MCRNCLSRNLAAMTQLRLILLGAGTRQDNLFRDDSPPVAPSKTLKYPLQEPESNMDTGLSPVSYQPERSENLIAEG